ncbi:acyltransferase [uncultured Polaribacter sp.]|uniref:acyltransferase n=1 Tax=uncultured Polaribacter sp. TaxID=174711 RepID=UPI00261EC99E|nr:acyltransferase [uncultured Polaribacter sp.]
MKLLFQKLLKRFGKTYVIDDNIPNSFILSVLLKRFFMIFRGVLFYRKAVFLGKSVNLKNKKNIFLEKHVTIENNVIIDGFCEEKLEIGTNSKIGAYSEVSCSGHFSKYGKGFVLGNNSGVGKFAFFGAAGGIEIGNNVIMGEYVSFHSQNHNFLAKDKLIKDQGVTSKGITLGNNIWVGAKCTFLDGSSIGDNSVVAAGALVKDIFPNNVLVAGVPAKIIKKI